ncbi:MAG: hypothetical protein ACKVUS_18510 [Saprospiraceae bacterium]
MSKTTLHALIVGIDTYDPYITVGGKACFHPLQGCVRDATALKDWLIADPDSPIWLKISRASGAKSFIKDDLQLTATEQ